VDVDASEVEEELGWGGVLQGFWLPAPSLHAWDMSGLRDEASEA
jgi:hypothetical protein